MGNACNSSGRQQSSYLGDEGEGQAVATEGPVLHSGPVLGVASCGVMTLSCSDDQRLCMFDWSGASETRYFLGHERAVNRAAVADGFVWSVSRDLSLRQWSAETASPLQTIAQTHELNVSSVAARSGCSRVFTGSRDYHCKGWDIETGKCIADFSSPRNIVTALEFEADSASNQLYQASEDLCVRVWDSRKSLASVPAIHITGFVYFPLCIAMHPDGHLMATGCKGFNSVGCEVKLWDLRMPSKPLAEFSGHSQDVTGCKFSVDGKALVSVSKDGSVFSWNLASSSPSPRLAQLSTGKIFSSLATVGESLLFAAGCFDGSLALIAANDSALQVQQATAPGFVIDTDVEAEAARRA